MFSAELQIDFDANVVTDATDSYRRRVAEAAGQEAVEVMQSGMRRVGRGSPPSAPGGFPHARMGDLRNGIQWAARTDGSVAVGPEGRPLPRGYAVIGASTIPEVINRGGAIRIARSSSATRRARVATLRLRPRPYVDLTLNIVADRIPRIAAQTSLN